MKEEPTTAQEAKVKLEAEIQQVHGKLRAARECPPIYSKDNAEFRCLRKEIAIVKAKTTLAQETKDTVEAKANTAREAKAKVRVRDYEALKRLEAAEAKSRKICVQFHASKKAKELEASLKDQQQEIEALKVIVAGSSSSMTRTAMLKEYLESYGYMER
ncbi:hypothetical protein ACLOJK_009722 [Asimina triloba]